MFYYVCMFDLYYLCMFDFDYVSDSNVLAYCVVLPQMILVFLVHKWYKVLPPFRRNDWHGYRR